MDAFIDSGRCVKRREWIVSLLVCVSKTLAGCARSDKLSNVVVHVGPPKEGSEPGRCLIAAAVSGQAVFVGEAEQFGAELGGDDDSRGAVWVGAIAHEFVAEDA